MAEQVPKKPKPPSTKRRKKLLQAQSDARTAYMERGTFSSAKRAAGPGYIDEVIRAWIDDWSVERMSDKIVAKAVADEKSEQERVRTEAIGYISTILRAVSVGIEKKMPSPTGLKSAAEACRIFIDCIAAVHSFSPAGVTGSAGGDVGKFIDTAFAAFGMEAKHIYGESTASTPPPTTTTDQPEKKNGNGNGNGDGNGNGHH